MTLKEISLLKCKIENEGFSYCFLNYSDWKDIKDKEFQKLKKEFVDSSIKLEEYLNKEAKRLNYNPYKEDESEDSIF